MGLIKSIVENFEIKNKEDLMPTTAKDFYFVNNLTTTKITEKTLKNMKNIIKEDSIIKKLEYNDYEPVNHIRNNEEAEGEKKLIKKICKNKEKQKEYFIKAETVKESITEIGNVSTGKKFLKSMKNKNTSKKLKEKFQIENFETKKKVKDVEAIPTTTCIEANNVSLEVCLIKGLEKNEDTNTFLVSTEYNSQDNLNQTLESREIVNESKAKISLENLKTSNRNEIINKNGDEWIDFDVEPQQFISKVVNIVNKIEKPLNEEIHRKRNDNNLELKQHNKILLESVNVKNLNEFNEPLETLNDIENRNWEWHNSNWEEDDEVEENIEIKNNFFEDNNSSKDSEAIYENDNSAEWDW